MLEDILKGVEKSKLILITDEVASCGRNLLLNFILESLERDCHVVVACTERPPQFFKAWLPSDLQHRVNFIESSMPGQDNEDILKKISDAVGAVGHQKIVVVVDSLSMPLLLADTPTVCQNLHKFCGVEEVCQVIALLHRDVHDESTQRLLHHRASTVLELSPGPQRCQTCHLRHCRPTGKVIKSAECFQFDNSFFIQNIRPLDKVDKPDSSHDEPNKSDPTSNLTFNLSLTSSEKEARSQVVLPYLKDRPSVESTTLTQGRIYYQADDADDLDEEDPDDDLNI